MPVRYEIPDVGERIKTPFGVARVLKIDPPEMWLHTDHGRWDWSQVFYVEPPEAGDVEAWEKYLTEPAIEVRGAVDIENVPCLCGCSQRCSVDAHRAKNTNVIVRQVHQRTTGCRCETNGCECV